MPDLSQPAYQDLLAALAREFTYTFGGCTIMPGLDGSYLSPLGVPIRDRVNLIYADAPFSFTESFITISRYADELKQAAFDALHEEAILLVVMPVHHAV